MPDVRMPDGTIIKNVPQGTTKSQLMAKLQIQQQQQQVEQPYSDSKVALSSVVKGLASIPDAVLNTPANLMNLGKAATGYVMNESGYGDLAQKLGFNDMTEPPSPVTNAVRNTAGLFEPRTSGQRVMDWAVQGATGAALTPTSSAGSLAKLLAYGGGAGATGGLVTEVTDNPVAGMLASTLVVPAAVAGANKLKQTIPNIMTQKGREANIGNFLVKNIRDPKAAVQQLRNAPEKPLVPSADKSLDLPPSKPTAAQIIAQNGDTQLLGIEKALAEVPSVERDMIVNRYEANAAARNAQMDRIVPIPRDSGADAVNAAIKNDIANKENTANQQINAANTQAAQARTQTGQQITAEQAGQTFLDDFDRLYAAKKQEVSNNFQVDPFNEVTNLPLNKQAVTQTIDEYYAGLKKPIPASVKQALGMIDEATGANTQALTEGQSLPDAQPTSATMTYKQMQTVASAIGDLQRSAGASGLMQDAAVLGKLKNIVRDSMNNEINNGNVPQDIANNYRAGLVSRREQAQQFEEGAAGKMRQFNGQRNVKAKDLPDLMLRSGGENLDSFNRSIGNEPVSKQAASDYLAMRWREAVTNPADGSLKSTWRQSSAVFLRENDAVIQQFPQLKKNLETAIKQSQSAADLEARLTNAVKQVKTETGARFFLNGIDPKNAFESFLRSKSRQKDGQYILSMAKKDPDFRKSTAGAIRDHIANLKNDQQRVAFIKDAQNQRLIKGLFGDGMLKQWQKIAADAERDLMRQTKNISRGSDTVNKAEGLRLAGKLTGKTMWTEIYNGLNNFIGGQARDALRAEAMLEPKKAADLIENKLNQPTFSDKFKEGVKINRQQFLQIQNKGNDEFVDEQGNVYVKKYK